MKRPRFRLAMGLLLCALPFVSGCIAVSDAPDEAVYTVAWWAQLAWLVFALVFTGIGLRFSSPTRKPWIILFGLIFVVAFSPSFFLEEVRVAADHFAVHDGMWFAPKVTDVRFTDLREIRLIRGGRSTEFICVSKSGGQQVIPQCSSLDAATDRILKRARTQGVAIVDKR